MADEPRRSGRATKGQYNKDRDIAEDATPKKKGKGRGKAAKQAEEEEEKEDDDNQEDYIRCVCGEYAEEEDFPRSMICCDKCAAWQHNMCMGLPEDYEPKQYFCEQCRPSDHKQLLDAIARGEKPWVEALDKLKAAAAAEKASKKKGKKGRKSAAAATPSQEVEEPPKTSGQKRKAEETPVAEVKSKKARGTPAAENGARAASSERQASTPIKRSPTVEASVDQAPTDIKELSNATRKGAASSLIKIFVEQIKDVVKGGTFKLPKDSSPQDAGTRLGLRIEYALFNVVQRGVGEPGEAYKAQLRAISFNIKKNPVLGERIIKAIITPDELASMDPKDMASEEQQKKDAALKEEMDKQHTIIHEQGPRIRRTHKGEEYVDEADQVAAESTTSNAPVRKQSTIDQSADVKSPVVDEKPIKGRHPLAVNTQAKARPSVDNRRKSSSNFDIDKVWSGVQGSPDGETPRMTETPHQGSPPPMNSTTGGDPEIDNLLKDEENESEPYSPKDFDEEGVVWRGSVNGGNLGKFRTYAKFAAGAKPDTDALRLTWDKLIPAEIVIHGRIQPQKADDYLCGLQYSNSSDLIIVSMAEPREREDVEGFEKLFRYFKTKGRYGVGVQHENPAIKDIYLLPMDAGQALPAFMGALEHEFPDPASERMVLVPIVIKNTELPHNMNVDGPASVMSPSVGPPVAQTPITPQESQREVSQQPQNGAGDNGGAGQWNGPPHQHMLQSPSPAQGHSMPANPSPAVSAAYRILGPQLANSVAVQQLLRSAPNVGDNEMKIVHECIKEQAQAANDLSVLTRMLQAKSEQSKENRNQGQNPVKQEVKPDIPLPQGQPSA